MPLSCAHLILATRGERYSIKLIPCLFTTVCVTKVPIAKLQCNFAECAFCYGAGKKTDRVAVTIRKRARVNELVYAATRRRYRQTSRFKDHFQTNVIDYGNIP